MKSNRINVFDPVVTEIKKLLDLDVTIQQAAQHVVQVPEDEEEMRCLIEQAVTRMGESAGKLFQWETSARKLTRTYLPAIHSAHGGVLAQKVEAWRNEFLSQVLQKFFQTLRGIFQISAEAAAQIADLEKTIPLDQKGKSSLMFETALRCGITAPALSAQLMLKAFTLTPDLLKDQANHLKGFVYEPEKYPQEEFLCCPVCGGGGVPYRNACSCLIADYHPMFLPVKLWMRCPECSSLYTRWFPKAYLAKGEKPPYIVEPQEGQITMQPTNSILLHNWSEVLNGIRPLTEGIDLLEVGIGTGELVAVALEMDYRVSAVELSEVGSQRIANLLDCPILCGDFLKMPEDRQYDVIIMGDVLEHLSDPVEGLEKAFRLLKENGVLWLSTPNYESAFSQMMKTDDPMWREPHHITYFSRKSLYSLVDRVGFHVVRYTVSGHYNGSMELILQKKQ